MAVRSVMMAMVSSKTNENEIKNSFLKLKSSNMAIKLWILRLLSTRRKRFRDIPRFGSAPTSECSKFPPGCTGSPSTLGTKPAASPTLISSRRRWTYKTSFRWRSTWYRLSGRLCRFWLISPFSKTKKSFADSRVVRLNPLADHHRLCGREKILLNRTKSNFPSQSYFQYSFPEKTNVRLLCPQVKIASIFFKLLLNPRYSKLCV